MVRIVRASREYRRQRCLMVQGAARHGMRRVRGRGSIVCNAASHHHLAPVWLRRLADSYLFYVCMWCTAGCRLLRLIGCDVAEAREFSITGFTLPEPPHVVLHPRFGFTPSTLRSRFTDPSQVHIRQGSTLVLEGDITIDSLDLEGALIVRAAPGARVHIKSLSVRNAGFKLVPLAEGESAPDSLKIRGYKLEKTGAEEIVSEEGEKVVE